MVEFVRIIQDFLVQMLLNIKVRLSLFDRDGD